MGSLRQMVAGFKTQCFMPYKVKTKLKVIWLQLLFLQSHRLNCTFSILVSEVENHLITNFKHLVMTDFILAEVC